MLHGHTQLYTKVGVTAFCEYGSLTLTQQHRAQVEGCGDSSICTTSPKSECVAMPDYEFIEDTSPTSW